MQLNGQVAVITGAARGIGYGIASTFSKAGAMVVVADLNQEDAVRAAEEIRIGTKGDVMGIAMDVTSEDSVEVVIQTITEAYGCIDILVSSAGIQCISSLDKLAYSDWKRVMATHLDGTFLITRACLKSMYALQRGGTVIYVGSAHSKTASILKGPYVTAKHGLLGLCRVVAMEGAPFGVRSNVICPGYVQTQLLEKQLPELARTRNMSEAAVIESLLRDTVDGQFTTVQEVADVALFLASQKTLALTGQSLIVSHGWVME